MFKVNHNGVTNRFKKLIGKRGRHWCDTCDAELVGKTEKCSVCGAKAKRKIPENKIPLDDE